MEYEYLLSLLECGMYERYFVDFEAMAVPFLDLQIYRRSTLENSSFLVSSVNKDTESHGICIQTVRKHGGVHLPLEPDALRKGTLWL